MTTLHANGFLLRPYTSADAPAFAAAVRESLSTVGKWMPWAVAGYSEEEALSWFDHCDACRENGTAYEFGIFLADGVSMVGGAGLNQINAAHNFCNLGYWVRESAQRQGAALAAASALAKHAFGQLGLTRVEIVVAAENTASFALALKLGALHEGLARNRLRLGEETVAAHMFSLVPGF